LDIHHNAHFTTLIATNTSYHYYDSLNCPYPHDIYHIHRTLKEWYKDLSTPSLFRFQHPSVILEIT
jgi:hypothetical protein